MDQRTNFLIHDSKQLEAWGVFTRTLSLFVTPKDTNDQGSTIFPSQHQLSQEFKLHKHCTIREDTNVDI